MVNTPHSEHVCMSEPYLHTDSHTNTCTHCRRTLFHLIFICLFHNCLGQHLGHLCRLPGLCSIPMYIHTYIHTYVYQTAGNTIQCMSTLVLCMTQLCTPPHRHTSVVVPYALAVLSTHSFCASKRASSSLQMACSWSPVPAHDCPRNTKKETAVNM